jgi:putative methionine-R-sulfoxide reductase with GAF domain
MVPASHRLRKSCPRQPRTRNALATHPPDAYRAAMNPDAIGRQLTQILNATADRATKASQAAQAIRAAGGYRWVGIYDVADQLVANLAWSGPGPPAHPVLR